jgi:predicted ATPase
VQARSGALPADAWPGRLAPVAQLLREGLDLGPATVLVGANGSGKSTLVEGIAMAFGLAPEGGSTGARHRSYASESPLHEALSIIRGPGGSRWGYFVRAETMHGLMGYLDETAQDGYTRDPTFHRFSHGESFLALLQTSRFAGEGFFVMDEPEAGLSFETQLTLVGQLTLLAARRGAQVLVATHSPVIAALPGARILQVDDTGIHPVRWEQLAVVDHYRRFLDAPQRYLRHLVEH